MCAAKTHEAVQPVRTVRVKYQASAKIAKSCVPATIEGKPAFPVTLGVQGTCKIDRLLSMAPSGQCGGKCELRIDRPRAIDCFERSFIHRLGQCRCITKRSHREVIGSTIRWRFAVDAPCLS